MIKKKLYGKTERLTKADEKHIVTEKIDGSNLAFFKLDGVLHIAQRNGIYTLSEAEEVTYKGLRGWLADHGEVLQDSLNENSAIVGEWVGMGRLKYDFENRFQMFAKANVYDDMELVRIKYDPVMFVYPFVHQEIPEFIGEVPLVNISAVMPTIPDLDILYEAYLSFVKRDVEGFIVYSGDGVRKYVRNKNGHVEPHKESYL